MFARSLVLLGDRSGNAAIEYGLIAACVALIAAVGMTNFSTAFDNLFITASNILLTP
ncbi:MAG: Flp family type IVb pilin [Alphaproteobacteria bacterium]|nr:Flp family type IVb pilin [Alphaproteobacteria bacterium]